jgi:hypothetical protein
MNGNDPASIGLETAPSLHQTVTAARRVPIALVDDASPQGRRFSDALGRYDPVITTPSREQASELDHGSHYESTLDEGKGRAMVRFLIINEAAPDMPPI